jgi:Cu2+-containing amine oxidase
MATVMNTTSSIKPTKPIHPLASLQPEEVTRARDIIVQHNSGRDILWKIIAVKEPPKSQVVTCFPLKMALMIVTLKLNMLDDRRFRRLV